MGRVKYLTNTAHWQFLGLLSGIVAWILIMITVGLNEWRLWEVADMSVINSGMAWVGIWRACFYSQVLLQFENCWSIGITDTYVPAEIHVARVLMVLAVISGLAGNISAAMAMRMAYFSVEDRRRLRLFFRLAGFLYLLTGILGLVPPVWNMISVLNNSTIDFPPEFNLPAAPVRQHIGSAIPVGMTASIVILICGLLFLCYRFAWQALKDPNDPLHGAWREANLARWSELPNGDKQGKDNPTFQAEQAL